MKESKKRRIAICGMGAVLSAILAFWFWPRPKFNVLLVTLDTTRADRLGCYGYSAARTPVLDALAASGVLCGRAFTVAPLTLPAHTTLFTGLYPPETGVRSNGRGRLNDTIPTLAEVLTRNDYDTAAFVASFVLDSRFGLARGFRKYDDEIAEERSAADIHHRERDGKLVVDAALAWLEEARSRPFFCWVHLYDPHAPYLAHSDVFADRFADRPYDAEIAYVDKQVGRLVDFLTTRAIASQTLIVVVGDHGEGLREHQEPRHGMTLYNSILHVPLIFRQGSRLVGGRRIPDNVSMVDVSPTILDLLGLADPRKISGQSFASLLRGGTSQRSACYAATDEPFLNNGWSPVRSLIESSWKYIRTTRPELYDLANDPAEQHDLAETMADRVREMESHLANFESRLMRRSDSHVQLRPGERRALESLGYLGGSKAGGAAETAVHRLPDIKDMLPFEMAVEDAGELVSQGDVDAAIGRLRKIIQDMPGHSKAHCYLADALRHQSKFSEAADVLGELLQSKPNAAEGHYGLALVRLAEGKDADAASLLTATLALDPDYAEAHYDLAMLHVRRGEPEDALAHFDAVLKIDHCHGAAYAERGTLLVTLGRAPEAIADYRRAMKFVPLSPSLHHNFGIVLAGNEQTDEALTHLRRAVELSPEIPEFRYSVGSLLVRQGQYDEAIRHLSKAVELKPGFAAAQKSLEEARQAAQK